MRFASSQGTLTFWPSNGCARSWISAQEGIVPITANRQAKANARIWLSWRISASSLPYPWAVMADRA